MQNFIKIDKDILFKRRTKVQFQVKISHKLHTQKLKLKNILIEQKMFFQKMYSLIALTILVFLINHFKSL